MKNPTRPDPSGWFLPAAAIVAGITLARLLLLRFNATDLFVDESQYWFWGQTFEFGYFSKPPLIAWLIGGMTALAGSDSAFWVRAPFSVCHGATALVLGALAARLHGGRIAILASTDSVMGPFFAAALYFHARLVETPKVRWAVLAGAAAGVAFLAKYAAVYFLLGVLVAAVVFPAQRFAVRYAAILVLVFVGVILPNLLWNAANGFATLSHTMDNVGWVRPDDTSRTLNPLGMIEFVLSQFAVFGPVLFAALVWATARSAGRVGASLLSFAIPALVIVSVQALVDRAYANWAASAFFAGTIVAVAALAHRPRLMAASLAINGAISLALPVLTTMPTLTFGGDRPVLARYLGQDELSHQIIAASEARGNLPIVADRRDVLADLFRTGWDAGIAIYARRPEGRPMNHYEAVSPLPPGATGPVLFVSARGTACPAAETLALDRTGGVYEETPLAAHVVDAACLASGR
jgi:hypothetical protein